MHVLYGTRSTYVPYVYGTGVPVLNVQYAAAGGCSGRRTYVARLSTVLEYGTTYLRRAGGQTLEFKMSASRRAPHRPSRTRWHTITRFESSRISNPADYLDSTNTPEARGGQKDHRRCAWSCVLSSDDAAVSSTTQRERATETTNHRISTGVSLLLPLSL